MRMSTLTALAVTYSPPARNSYDRPVVRSTTLIPAPLTRPSRYLSRALDRALRSRALGFGAGVGVGASAGVATGLGVVVPDTVASTWTRLGLPCEQPQISVAV